VIKELCRCHVACLHRIEARGSEIGLTDELHENAVNNAVLFRSMFDGPPLSAAAYTPASAALAIEQKQADAEASIMAAVQKPLSIRSFTGKSGPPAWKHLPSWYLVSSNDQMIPPAAEEFMAKRMSATVRKVPSIHASPVSHPKDVVGLITLAAESGRAQELRKTA
jgi:pimeloyl-ACP methyl ester carboxylesterase